LGVVKLDNLNPAPRGVPKIEVTFDIDANGILNVSAIDTLTGLATQATITGSSSLASDEIQKMISDAEDSKSSDTIFKEANNIKEQLNNKLIQVESFLNDTSIFDDEIISDLVDLKDSLEEALSGENKLEMLSSLNVAAKETITSVSRLVNQEAASLIK